jgi:hypothetical protein
MRSPFFIGCWLLMGVLCWPTVQAQVVDSESSALEVLSAPLDLIDYEIHLLRAELAVLHQDAQAFSQHYSRLIAQPIPSVFSERVETLHALYQHAPWLASASSTSTIAFSSAQAAQTLVVLLPLSGAYHQAAHALLSVLQRALPSRQIYVLDTDLYENMAELWALVSLFDPQLIIGPLEPTKVEALMPFINQRPIPTIVFTSISQQAAHIRSMASWRDSQLRLLIPLLAQMDWDAPAWLYQQPQRVQPLIDGVARAYAEQGVLLWSSEQVIEQTLEAALAKLMGAQKAQSRYQWLQRTLERKLNYIDYSRQDRDVLLAQVDAQRALQLTPLLDFYQQRLPVIWLPPILPDKNQLRQTLPLWQSTYAFLPAYFVESVQKAAQDETQSDEVGLFYALGELAVQMIQQASQPLPVSLDSQLGRVFIEQDGRYHILPKLYRLDKGQIFEADGIELRRESMPVIQPSS